MIFKIEGIRTVSSNRRYKASPAYMNYKAHLQALFEMEIEEKGFERFSGPYEIRVKAKTYKDIDNIIKPLLDALQAARVLDDDREVVRTSAEKIPGEKGAPEDLEIEVLPAKAYSKI